MLLSFCLRLKNPSTFKERFLQVYFKGTETIPFCWSGTKTILFNIAVSKLRSDTQTSRPCTVHMHWFRNNCTYATQRQAHQTLLEDVGSNTDIQRCEGQLEHHCITFCIISRWSQVRSAWFISHKLSSGQAPHWSFHIGWRRISKQKNSYSQPKLISYST